MKEFRCRAGQSCPGPVPRRPEHQDSCAHRPADPAGHAGPDRRAGRRQSAAAAVARGLPALVPAGPRTPLRLLADKAYSHPSTRQVLRRRRIAHTIPERSDQKARRQVKGSAGGRPPAFDKDLYKLRNTVERGFLGLKQWRGVATRYDKHALTFLGGVLLAVAITHTRTN